MTMPSLPPFNIRRFEESDTAAVLALWTEAFPEYGDARAPQRDPRLSIRNKLRVQRDLFFVAQTSAGTLAGTVMAGFDGHRGWIYSLAVATAFRRHGIGTALMRHAEAALAAHGCPKVNLQIRTDKPDLLPFYHALGYGQDAVVSLGKRLMAVDHQPA